MLDILYLSLLGLIIVIASMGIEGKQGIFLSLIGVAISLLAIALMISSNNFDFINFDFIETKTLRFKMIAIPITIMVIIGMPFFMIKAKSGK